MANARASRGKSLAPNTDLIARLKSWVSKTRTDSDPYVREVLRSLDTFDDIEAIAELNPLEMLPQPRFTAGDKRIKVNNILTIIRNVLVFVPVALTWIAVSKATTAFAVYTNANPDAIVNFLEFWQNGYEVLAKEWTIAHVALLDFAFIIVVIVLTLITALVSDSHQRQEDAYLNTLENERIEIGIELHKYLFSFRRVTSETISAGVQGSVRTLAATSKVMAQASKDLKKDIGAIPHKDVLKKLKKFTDEN